MEYKKKLNNFISIIKSASYKTLEHDGVEHAGYMSFMLLLSLFPFLATFIVITNWLGMSETGKKFLLLIYNHLSTSSTNAIKDPIENLILLPPQKLTTIFLIGYVWTSSSFIEGIRTILNKAHQVENPPKYLIRRILSLVQFFIITIILIIILLAFFFIPKLFLKTNFYKIFLYFIKFNKKIKYITLEFILFIISLFLYYLIPNKKMQIRKTIPGAIFTSIFWLISVMSFSKYIIYYNQVSKIYGSLGSIILTLILFYIINIIFIYGAEINSSIEQKKINYQ